MKDDFLDKLTPSNIQEDNFLDSLGGGEAAPTTPENQGFSWKDTANNIIPSGVQFFKDLAGAFVTKDSQSPLGMSWAFDKTGENVGNSILGFVEKLIPGNQDHEKYADSIINYFSDRYGGFDNLLTTIQSDPVGFSADLSTIFGGVGAATQGSKIGLLSKVGKVAETTGKVLNPVTMPTTIGEGVRSIFGATRLPESVYARTLKMPPGSVREESRASVLNTLVREEKLPLGGQTHPKMKQIVSQLDTKIDQTLDALSQQGAQVDINVVVTALDDLKKTYKNRPNPQPYYDAIDAVKDDFISHSFVNQGNLSLIDAKDLKKGTYAEIQSYYMKQQKPESGRIGIQNDVDAAAKASAAKALRQAIIDEPTLPAVIRKDMAREAGLMNARKWVERATNRGGNLDPISLSGMMFSMMVEKGLPAMAAWRIAVSQPVMSRFAIWLGSGSEKLSLFEKAAMPITTGGYQAGRLPYFTKENK